jgi:hypothetical protein
MSRSGEARRRFSMADQLSFAALSGDRNSIHLDAVAARRTIFGRAVVHGIHLLMWSLECMVESGLDIRAFASLRVHFDNALGLEEEVRLSWHHGDKGIQAKLLGTQDCVARFSIAPGPRYDGAWTGRTIVAESPCFERGLSELDGLAADEPLSLAPSCAQYFPHLAAKFSPTQVAILLATTRVVGMICPGLHSLYSSLSLTCGAGIVGAQSFRFRVARIDSRVRLVDMKLNGPGIEGAIGAFLRPAPMCQPSLFSLSAVVDPDAFRNQSAMVVGGSRGLGELTAKLLLAGNAKVTITYVQGKADSERICDEARGAGRSIDAVHFDVVRPPKDHDGKYSHLYYFATPKITNSSPGAFSIERFNHLLEFYALGTAKTAAWLSSRALRGGCFWYPSTIFLDQPHSGFAEYTAAKACGEALCTRLGIEMAPMRFVVARLPRLPSDQTQALTALKLEDGVSAIYSALRQCELSSRG